MVGTIVSLLLRAKCLVPFYFVSEAILKPEMEKMSPEGTPKMGMMSFRARHQSNIILSAASGLKKIVHKSGCGRIWFRSQSGVVFLLLPPQDVTVCLS